MDFDDYEFLVPIFADNGHNDAINPSIDRVYAFELYFWNGRYEG